MHISKFWHHAHKYFWALIFKKITSNFKFLPNIEKKSPNFEHFNWLLLFFFFWAIEHWQKNCRTNFQLSSWSISHRIQIIVMYAYWAVTHQHLTSTHGSFVATMLLQVLVISRSLHSPTYSIWTPWTPWTFAFPWTFVDFPWTFWIWVETTAKL